MPTPRPKIRLATVTALIALLAACAGAIDEPFAQPAPGTWPPVWQDEPRPVPAQAGAVAFSPPVAAHCRRAPTTREVPGRPWPMQQGALRDKLEEGVATSRAAGEAKASMERAPAAAAASPAPREMAKRDAAGDAFAGAAPAPWPQTDMRRRERPASETVTAGVVDDNADFGEYLAYRERHAGLPVRDRDVSERHLVEVTDAAGRPVHDAEVAVQRHGIAAPLAWARTDTAGRVWLHPRAFADDRDELATIVDQRWPRPPQERSLGIAVRKGDWQARATLVRGAKQALQVRLGGTPLVQRPRLDLVFMVDATGSMGDEIAKLKTSLRAMAQQIAQLPGQPDICWGLVAYRDRGDAFMTRTHDFTDDLGAFQNVLARVQASGGGDTPEALNEALHEVVHGLAWRRDAARLVVMVADAPPHLDYGGPQYDTDMQAALAKGIKLFAVGASGLDPVGEYVFRQIAQYTAGRFVFLTYRDAANPGSGPGAETVHDVRSYSVQTLDRLVVRLVGEEMARLPRS